MTDPLHRESLDRILQRREVERSTGRDLDLVAWVLAAAKRETVYGSPETDEPFRQRVLELLGLGT